MSKFPMEVLFLLFGGCFFLMAAATGSHQDQSSTVLTSASHSSEAPTRKFEFNPEFRKLVREAVDKRLDGLDTITTLSRELTLLEN